MALPYLQAPMLAFADELFFHKQMVRHSNPNQRKEQPKQKRNTAHKRGEWVETLKVILTALSTLFIFAAGAVQLIRDMRKENKPAQITEPAPSPPKVENVPEQIEQPRPTKRTTTRRKPQRKNNFANSTREPK